MLSSNSCSKIFSKFFQPYIHKDISLQFYRIISHTAFLLKCNTDRNNKDWISFCHQCLHSPDIAFEFYFKPSAKDIASQSSNLQNFLFVFFF
jgi:hypothetical protein